MEFSRLVFERQSDRKYDSQRNIEDEKIDRILEAARLSPSACNGQPYHAYVCRGEVARRVGESCTKMGMNKFAPTAPVLIVITERPLVASAAFGARMLKNDYRSVDIGIFASYITLAAADEGLGSCILGWFDRGKLCEAIGTEDTPRLVITLGYTLDGHREKKRAGGEELFTRLG